METSLMDYLDGFKKALTREKDSIGHLLRMENQKYEALKQVDVKKLMEINSLEEEVLQLMDNIEQKRKDIILRLSRQMGFDPNATLSEVLARIPDDKFALIKRELLALRDEIKAGTENLRVTLKENSEMIQTNLEIINLTLNYANRNSIKDTYNYRDKKESKDSIYIINQIA